MENQGNGRNLNEAPPARRPRGSSSYHESPGKPGYPRWGETPAPVLDLIDRTHGTELLKQHADSQWHRDAAATAIMARQAESGKSVLELQCSSAAQQAAERRQRNRDAVEISILSCQE